VQQGYAYACDGSDLVMATTEQLEKYKDGWHRGRKKLEEVERAEAARVQAEGRMKGG